MSDGSCAAILAKVVADTVSRLERDVVFQRQDFREQKIELESRVELVNDAINNINKLYSQKSSELDKANELIISISKMAAQPDTALSAIQSKIKEYKENLIEAESSVD